MGEKANGAAPVSRKANNVCNGRWSRLLRVALAACVIGTAYHAWNTSGFSCHSVAPKNHVAPSASAQPLCPQTELLYPHVHKEYAESLDSSLKDADTKSWVLENLAGAVRVP